MAKTVTTVSTEEMAEQVGITIRQAYHWIDKDWVYPDEGTGIWLDGGRRPTLRWTEGDVARVRRHKALMDAGVAGEAAANLLDQSKRGGMLSPHVKVTLVGL